jgi:GT2 family glycosyltransferase
MERSEAGRLLEERAERRRAKDFASADELRDRLRAGGWEVVDTPQGSQLREIELPPPGRAVTMLTIVHGWPTDAERWLGGVLSQTAGHDFEALLVDNSGDPAIAHWLAGQSGERVRALALDSPLGWAEAANRGLEAAAGDVVALFDPGIELTGDVAGPLLAALGDPGVVAAGAFGVRSEGSVGHFHSHLGPEVDAVEGYVLAVRRAQALEVGGFDRRFRFYRLADFELCFRLRDRYRGRTLVLPELPVVKHEHRLWDELEQDERDRLSRRNFYRFMDRWGKRVDLVTGTLQGRGSRRVSYNREEPDD